MRPHDLRHRLGQPAQLPACLPIQRRKVRTLRQLRSGVPRLELTFPRPARCPVIAAWSIIAAWPPGAIGPATVILGAVSTFPVWTVVAILSVRGPRGLVTAGVRATTPVIARSLVAAVAVRAAVIGGVGRLGVGHRILLPKAGIG